MSLKPKVSFHDTNGKPIMGEAVWLNDSVVKFSPVEDCSIGELRAGGNEHVLNPAVWLNRGDSYTLTVIGFSQAKDWFDDYALTLKEEFSATDGEGVPISIFNETRVAEALREAHKKGGDDMADALQHDANG